MSVKPCRILIVDDSPEDREAYRRLILKGHADDYTVVEADCGEAGLRLCRSDPPDCLLLDYSLPDTDGLEFLAELRADAPGKKIPVVFLTGHGNEAIAVQAMKQGAIDYVVKGNISADSVSRAIHNAIERALLQCRLRRKFLRREKRPAFLWKLLSRSSTLFITPLLLAAATLVRAALQPVWESDYAFITYFPAIMFITLVGGWKQGLFATAISALLAFLLFFDRHLSFEQAIALLTFMAVNTLMISLAESVNMRRRRTEKDIVLTRRSEEAIRQELYALRQAEAALRASEERFRGLVEQAVDGIFVSDAEGRFIDVNTAGAQMLGYERVELLHLGYADVIAADELPRAATEAAKLSGGAVARSEWRFMRKDGSFFSGEIVGRQLSDGRVQAILRDITERKHMEEALKESDRRKDDFIATLAHELRNPLAPIRNAVAILRKKAPADPQLAWCRDVIDRQVGQMTYLLDDLLDVSRITRDKLILRIKRVELTAVIEQAVEIARPLIDARDHALTLELPPEPVLLDGDPMRLAQIFSNLLTNAAKYSDKGTLIRLNAVRSGNEIVVSVKDRGIGIVAENLPRVFEMFNQAQTALNRSHGGLGIGLALVRKLVEMHGGIVVAHSAGPNRGSEFIIRLPVAEDFVPKELKPDTNSNIASTQKFRILVADDLHDSAESMKMLLGVMGHEVRTAHDGAQAVEVAEEFRPCVALLDIGMPKLNGYEACRRIRSEPWGKDMILIALTGWGQDEDKRRTQEAGFNHHLVKPVDIAALINLLDGLNERCRNESREKPLRTA